MVVLAPATSNCKCAAPVLAGSRGTNDVSSSAPLAAHQSLSVAMEQASRFTERAAQATAKTLPDAVALARRFNDLHDATLAAVARPMRAARGAASRTAITAMTQHVERSVALTTKDALALAGRYQARAASATALKHEEALAFATRFNAQYNRSAAQNLGDALAFAGRFKERYDASAGQTLQGALAFAQRFKLKASGRPVTDVPRKPGPVVTVRGAWPQPPGGGLGAGTISGSGIASNLEVPSVPLAFQNALWTRFDPPAGIRITDIAVGAATVSSPAGALRPRVVWATGVEESGPLTFVYRMSANGVFEEQVNVLAAEPALPVQVAAARDTGQPFVFRRDSPVWTLDANGSDWHLRWTYPGIVDLAAGRLGTAESQEIWWVDDAGSLYQIELSGSGPGAAVVSTLRASNIARVSIAADGTLWTVDRDGRVRRGTGFQPITVAGFASDVAAVPGGDVYVIGTKRANDAVTSSGTIPAAGNEIWWWNHFTNRWTKVEPGWGVAIDVDDDGTLWVVDEVGRVWSRGASVASLWPWVTSVGPDANNSKKAFEAAGEAGAGGLMRLWHWSSATAPNLVKDKGLLLQDIAEADRLGFEVFFNFGVIFTSDTSVPGATNGQAGQFVASLPQFKATIDWLASLPAFARAVKYLSIGNEIDVYFKAHTLPGSSDAWYDYAHFFATAAAYCRVILPNVLIGTTFTSRGLLAVQSNPAVQAMAAESDFVGLTYYPAQEGYDASTPSRPGTDLPVFVKLAEVVSGRPGMPLAIQEVNLPSYADPAAGWIGPELPTSANQAEFVKSLLGAWAMLGTRVPFLSWFQLYDWPLNQYGALRYGGLRGIDGSAKPGYDVFHDALVARMVQQ